MSDLYLSRPNQRVNINQPQRWNNIYIFAKEIYVNNILDVSNSVSGGSGGDGGNSIQIPIPVDITSASQAVSGRNGSDGFGPNPGQAGGGGAGFSLGINDYTVGNPGISGLPGSSPSTPSFYKAYSPVEDWAFRTVQDLAESGSGGGGGGGGSAGDSITKTCKQDLVAGSGGGGGAGGFGGGKIVLIATDAITFGPNAVLKSTGGYTGLNGAIGEYEWNETTDNNGVVTTRLIQTASSKATKTAIGGLGGSDDENINISDFSNIYNESLGGDGGLGGLNYKLSDVGTPGECQYSQELAEAKKGGNGGKGGAGSGGSILLQSPSIQSFSNYDVSGGNNNEGIVLSANDLNDITLFFTPSSRDAYIYFDSIKAHIDTNVNDIFTRPTISNWSSDFESNIFSTTEGEVLSSTDLLNLVLSSTSDNSTIYMLASANNGTIVGANALPSVSVFGLSAEVSSQNTYVESNTIKGYLCNTFAFSGQDLGILYTSSSVNKTYGDNTFSFTVTSDYIKNGVLNYGERGTKRSSIINDNTIVVSISTSSPSESSYLFTADGTGNLTSNIGGISGVDTNSFFELISPVTSYYIDDTEYNGFSNIVESASSNPYVTTFLGFLSASLSFALPLSTSQNMLSTITDVEALSTNENYVFAYEDYLPLLLTDTFFNPISTATYFCLATSDDVPYGSVLDTTQNVYFSVYDGSDVYTLSTDYSNEVIPGSAAFGYYMDTSNINITGILLNTNNVEDIVLISDLSGIDTSRDLPLDTVGYIKIISNPSIFNFATTELSGAADYYTTRQASIFPPIGVVNLTPSNVNPTTIEFVDETIYSFISGSDYVSNLPQISGFLDISSGDFSTYTPTAVSLSDVVSAVGAFNVALSGEMNANYSILNGYVLSAAFSFPDIMNISECVTFFKSITAEEQPYASITLSDNSQLTPFNSIETQINNNEQYIGYAPLSSTWNLDINNPWFFPSNVLSWAADTDVITLNQLIGLSGYETDDANYSSALQAITSFNDRDIILFPNSGDVTLTRGITAVPSGVNQRYEDVYESSIVYDIDYEETYIDTFDISPLSGYYNDTDITITYNYKTCETASPTGSFDVYLQTYNTTETELVTSIDYNGISTGVNFIFPLTSTKQDVGRLRIENSNNFINSSFVAEGNYYPAVSVNQFDVYPNIQTGYVSATPFIITSNVNTYQDDILIDTNNIVAQASAVFDYSDGLGRISDIVNHGEEELHFNKTIFINDTGLTELSAWLSYTDGFNNVSTALTSVSTILPPSATYLDSATDGCKVSSVNGYYYLGGELTFEGSVVSYGLPYVTSIVSNSADNVEIVSTQDSIISASINFDNYFINNEFVSFVPQLWIYPLLAESNINLYQDAYLDSGLDIVKFNFDSFTYIPSTYRANLDNIVFNSFIPSSTSGSYSISGITTTSNYISADILINQFNNTVTRPVSTTISLLSAFQGLVDNNSYGITATLFETNYIGTTSVDLYFNQVSAGQVEIPISFTDGCNIENTSISFVFSRYEYITPTMYFENTLPVSYMGCRSTVPQKLIFWDDVARESHTAVLYARGSNSIPYYEKNNRWDHLLPRWRFTDIDGNVVDSISSTNVYLSSDTRLIGVSGVSEFYYVDDLPTGEEGLLLVATLSSHSFASPLDVENAIDLPGFANSKLNAVELYHVNDLPATDLTITRDGLRTHRPYYWTDTKVPYTITLSSNVTKCADCNSIVFTFPQLSAEEYDYSIEMQSVSANFFPINSAFKAFDDDGLPIGGFVRGTMQPFVSGSTVSFFASTVVSLSGLYSHQPQVWISNPENRTLNLLTYNPGGVADEYKACMDTYTSSSYLSANSLIIDVPYISAASDSMYLTGFGGMWGLGVDGCYNVWAADTEMDTLRKYNPVGEELISINLADGSAPAGVSVDKNNDVYVTLKDSVSTLKFSTEGLYITALIPENGFITDELSNNIFNPSQVEVDSNNDVWVSYYNPLCSCVIKYNQTTYEEEIRVDLSPYFSPFDLDIGENNILYVTTQFLSGSEEYATRHFVGALHEITSTGTLTTTLSDLNNPHYLALDENNNAWFSEGVSVVSVLSGSDLVSYYLSGGTTNDAVIERVEAAALPEGFGDDAQIGGIGHTANGYTYVIQSKENMVYIFNTDTFELVNTFNVYPDGGFDESARAFGDWTGFAWYNKFIRIPYENQTVELSGRSTFFDILDAPEDIRLKNDSYNLSQTISNLFLQPQAAQNINPVLHDDYFPSVFGTPADGYQTIGRQYYEKIANFVQNNKDIETCNIPQLYSICKAIDVPVDDYNLSYPADLSRLMDIVSIHYSTLRGVKDKYNLYLGPYGCNIPSQYTNITNQEYTINRHLTALDTDYVTSSGEGLIVLDNINNKYDLIYVNDSTALSALSGFGLREPLIVNNGYNGYSFFKYNKDNHRSAYVNNLIDWENEYNSISYEVSSINDWYGEYGLIEKWFDYEIHKGLGFI